MQGWTAWICLCSEILIFSSCVQFFKVGTTLQKRELH